MEIDVSLGQGSVPVTIVEPHGHLDGSNYAELINKLRRLVAEGKRDFLINLGDVAFMSSAGLMAIFSAALMLRGEKIPDLEAGKAAVKSMDRSITTGHQKHIKLLNPHAGVADTLEKVGFMQLFEVFSNLPDALASF
jgi:anti-anti-sigma regulatory factor